VEAFLTIIAEHYLHHSKSHNIILELSNMECSKTNLFKKLQCILLYDGSRSDILTNYPLLFINAFAVSCLRLQMCRQIPPAHACRYHQYLICASLFVLFFQVILCLILGCAGISITWAACAGWLTSEIYFFGSLIISPCSSYLIYGLALSSVTLDSMVIIYYALLSPPITTIAHLLAVLMGMLLSYFQPKLQIQILHAPYLNSSSDPLLHHQSQK